MRVRSAAGFAVSKRVASAIRVCCSPPHAGAAPHIESTSSARLCQALIAGGIGKVHRMPLAELKCMSPNRVNELNLYLGLGRATDRIGAWPPPAAHTFQSDVETVHRLVEDEFFDLETVASRGEFLAKAQTYQVCFNLARPNSHKQFQTPWQIIERLASRSTLQPCLLPPVFLDYYLDDSGGYDVPSYR